MKSCPLAAFVRINKKNDYIEKQADRIQELERYSISKSKFEGVLYCLVPRENEDQAEKHKK